MFLAFVCCHDHYLYTNSRTMKEEEFSTISPNIKKKIIKKGKFGRRPSLGWVCQITVSNENPDMTDIIEIKIGDGCSPKDRLIESCVQSMHLEEESFFVIKLEKEDTVLKTNLILKCFREKPYIFQWSEEEKLEACDFYKAMGTELFKENKIEEAFYKFSTALKFSLLLDSVLEMDEQNETVTGLRTALYNNLARCHLHFKNYSSVVRLCSDSLKLQRTSKAYYRRAVANIQLKEYGKAEKDLIELLKLEPKNKAALEKYNLVRELDKTNRENYESIIRKMFS